ncbi:MAG: hemerythrin domain-containing protein [Byssovorax sp.]
MKATDLLKAQHHDVADLFKRFEKSRKNEEKLQLFEELASSLAAHDAIERELFYPACEEKMGETDTLDEAVVEHGLVEFSLYLADEARGHEDFDTKVKVLKEVVEHHVEEEEKEFFPKVEKALGAEKLKELGVAMKARFEEAKAEDFRGPLHENLREVLAGATKTVDNPKAKKRVARKPAKKASAKAAHPAS